MVYACARLYPSTYSDIVATRRAHYSPEMVTWSRASVVTIVTWSSASVVTLSHMVARQCCVRRSRCSSASVVAAGCHGQSPMAMQAKQL